MYEHKHEILEQYIIKMMLSDEKFLRAYFSKIHQDYFSDSYKGLIFSLLHFFKEKQKIPSRKILEDIYVPKIFKNKSEDSKLKCLESIKNVYEMDINFEECKNIIKDDIDEFLFKRNLVTKLLQAYSELENDTDKAVSILKDGLQTNFSESFGIEYFSDLEQRAERLKTNPPTIIKSGLESLNILLGGGYRKKELYIYAGPANSGKSLVLNNEAVDLALQGLNVFYGCLELTEDYVAQRSDAKFGEISMNVLNADPIEGVKRSIAKLKVKRDSGCKIGKLYYKEWPANTASYVDITSMIKNIESSNNFKFDVIIIDYLKLIRASGKVYGDTLYSKLTTVCEELRKLAFELDVCILTASQTNKESFNSSSPGMEHLSDSIGISQTADGVITLGKDPTLNKENLMMLTVAKSRHSRNGTQMLVKVDYDHMRLIDTKQNESVYSSETKEQINKKNNNITQRVKSIDDDFFNDEESKLEI